MKTIQLSALFAVALILGSTAMLHACENVPQPKIGCTIGQGQYAARYIPKPGQTPTGPCAALMGERISLRDYTEGGKNYIAIRSTLLGSDTRTDPNPDHKPYSFGEYPFNSDENFFCNAGTLSPAIQVLPASGSQPAVDRKYEWSNVRFLVTPRAAGTQMAAELKFTDNIAGCTAVYNVIAMWPAIDCGSRDPGTGLMIPDNNKCATVANPDAGIRVACNPAIGCVSPDFKIHCDADILHCMLDQPPPSLK